MFVYIYFFLSISILYFKPFTNIFSDSALLIITGSFHISISIIALQRKRPVGYKHGNIL